MTVLPEQPLALTAAPPITSPLIKTEKSTAQLPFDSPPYFSQIAALSHLNKAALSFSNFMINFH